MLVMAEKGGMHMFLEMKRRVKVRLPRGTDASSIWLKAHAWAQANMQRTLFEGATGTPSWCCIPICREWSERGAESMSGLGRFRHHHTRARGRLFMKASLS
jgi:hypothetical protein